MTLRRAWLPFVAIALVLAIALLVSGLRRAPIRVYALGSPNQSQVAVLTAQGRQVCEGPIKLAQAVGAVRVWVASVDRPSRLAVSVSRATMRPSWAGPQLAAGETAVFPTPNPYTTPLDRRVGAAEPIVICVSTPATPVVLLGWPSVHGSIVAFAGRQSLRSEFSLVLLSAGAESRFGALGTVASRASLFRFSWVGPWTFWLLAAALVAAVGAGAASIRAAAEADGRPPDVTS